MGKLLIEKFKSYIIQKEYGLEIMISNIKSTKNSKGGYYGKD